MELKACPCCGNVAEVEITELEIQVRCLGCDLKLKRPREDVAVVIEAWNKRVRLGLKPGN
jgi:hypothetical protein